MKLRFALILAVLMPALCWAQASPVTPSFDESGFSPGLLDPSVPQVERVQLFDRLMDKANRGQVRAQDLAGTLVWQGPAIDGSPVPRNLAQARNLLANAAVNGDVICMAKMAELELGAGRASKAMVWAQLYARYLDPLKSVRSRSRRRSGYASDLIRRIDRAGGEIDKTVKAEVAAMVARFDASIRRGIDAFSERQRSGETFLIRRPSGQDKREDVNVNGLAEYMVEFDPDGKPGQVWLVNAIPGPRIDSIVRSYLDLALANKVDGDSGPRYLKVSIVHGARNYRVLRPTH